MCSFAYRAIVADDDKYVVGSGTEKPACIVRVFFQLFSITIRTFCLLMLKGCLCFFVYFPVGTGFKFFLAKSCKISYYGSGFGVLSKDWATSGKEKVRSLSRLILLVAYCEPIASLLQ